MLGGWLPSKKHAKKVTHIQAEKLYIGSTVIATSYDEQVEVSKDGSFQKQIMLGRFHGSKSQRKLCSFKNYHWQTPYRRR